ncbi:hypothetical protein PAB09_05405 [Corynebacterium sp. SCR221107]|uniref:hypothetical protein n=1 Tax=Corynebacterium sp. SCR221107 TaxID=3017361 RepID=UPI0022EC2DC2|nr:hypothetical protein [Corynebacterium sp. SCR221107]WBT09735.1 hypothetical protein PAB09_05405 [Corynebacterium sp. SCR221107]
MGLFDRFPARKAHDVSNGNGTIEQDYPEVFLDIEGSDHARLAEESGPVGKALIVALDKAAHMQSSVIVKYVDWLRSRNPDATPADIQRLLDKHFLTIVTGSGASAGATSAIPGIGFVTGALAVGAESLVFLDAATVYALASSHVRGADIKEPERRKALILIALLGSSGTALVDASIGGGSPAALISRLSLKNVTEVNNRLLKMAIKKVSKSVRLAWLGKLLPLGVGVVVGSLANRRIAERVAEHVHTSLGSLPQTFSSPAPDYVEEPAAQVGPGTRG